MSTQHPDNVRPPFFSDNSVLGGDDEIKEAFYGFSHLGCREQLWDCEGKEVDNFVVKKLLTRYENYFSKLKSMWERLDGSGAWDQKWPPATRFSIIHSVRNVILSNMKSTYMI